MLSVIKEVLHGSTGKIGSIACCRSKNDFGYELEKKKNNKRYKNNYDAFTCKSISFPIQVRAQAKRMLIPFKRVS